MRVFVMPDHAFHKIDREDRKDAYNEAFAGAMVSWFTVGVSFAFGIWAALVFWGVI